MARAHGRMARRGRTAAPGGEQRVFGLVQQLYFADTAARVCCALTQQPLESVREAADRGPLEQVGAVLERAGEAAHILGHLQLELEFRGVVAASREDGFLAGNPP